MKRFAIIFLIVPLFFSCKNEYQPRTIENFTIQEFKIDSASIRAIAAVDKNTLYFAGSNGKVGFTKNAGNTWTINTIRKDSISPNFRSIAKTKEALFALSIGNPALLYKIENDIPKVVYTETHEKVFYDCLQFFENGIDGIAVGDPTEDCPSIIMTNDGGNTWKKIPCENLPKFEQGEAFFAASNTNIKILNNTIWIGSGGKNARILKSEDRGKTWTIQNTPIIHGNGPQGIYSVDFYDENNGIIFGGDYSKTEANFKNKAITKDGGKTWTTVSDNSLPGYKSCVQYVPNTDGKEVFAVGKTGISFSNDGGITWKDISTESFYTIAFIDKNSAWLAGNNRIAKLSID